MTGQLMDRGETRKGHAWLLRVYLGERAGKRTYKSTTFYGTEKQARREFNRLVAEWEGGACSSERYGAYFERFFKSYEGSVRPSAAVFVRNCA
ncbi:MAG: hypothetical protein ACYCVB_03375 [Bacilli bacterium]